jgi:hypothetical protein
MRHGQGNPLLIIWRRTAPNHGVQLTASSLRYAAASGSS